MNLRNVLADALAVMDRRPPASYELDAATLAAAIAADPRTVEAVDAALLDMEVASDRRNARFVVRALFGESTPE